MNFGGCSLPAATPRNAPMPISWHSARSYTLTLSREPLASSVAAGGRRPIGGRGGPPGPGPPGGPGARAGPGAEGRGPVGGAVGDPAPLAPELLGVEHALELTLRRAIETRQALRQPRLSGVQTD